MKIAFHIGANCTDGDRLLKSILKNAGQLLSQGISVPGPGRYRALIRETINALNGTKLAADTRDILIDTIIEHDNVNRLVLSNDNFVCIPNRIFDNGIFYSQAEAKTRALKKIFKGDDISLFLGIRNPASFLQDAFGKSKADTLTDYLGLMNPEDVHWSDVVKRIKSAVPDIPLTVWCNEDSPLLWEDLIRAISGLHPDTPIAGGLDMLSTIISRDGIGHLQKHLAEPQSNTARHEVIAEIWEKHANGDELEDEILLPELDPALVDDMTDMYDEDVAKIGQMDGVRLILPFEDTA